MTDGLLGGAGASPPSFILDLSNAKEDGGVRFLSVYKQEDGKLADLALVCADAVFSSRKTGLEGCVYKPPSRKSLKTKDHIAKVGQALEAVAAADAAADAGAGGAPSSATSTTAAAPKAATIALGISGTDSAKLTLKEVKPLGAVDLAVVTLPVVSEAGDGSLLRGLLLGAVSEAHRRTRGAEAMQRDRDRARKEQVKVQGLLDGAIRDKRKTVTNILEKAVLVVNAKKNRIDALEEKIEMLQDSEGGSGDEQASACGSNGSGSGPEEDEVSTGDENWAPRAGTAKRKGKAASSARPPGADGDGLEPAAGKSKRVGSGSGGKKDGSARRGTTTAAAAAAAGGAGGAGGGSSSPSAKGPDKARRGGGGENVKTKAEPKLGAGGGVLATPMGTQELSQDELFDLVDAKVKTEVAGVDSGDGDNGKDRRNPRVGGGGGSGLKHALGPGGPEKNFGGDDAGEKEEDDVGVGAGGSEAALYVGNLGDSSGSDEDGNAVQASRRVRRRKKVKKNDTTAAAAQGGNSSSGGGGGGVGSASGAGAAAGHRDAGGGASGRDTGNKGLNFWEQVTADDSDDDLDGMK